MKRSLGRQGWLPDGEWSPALPEFKDDESLPLNATTAQAWLIETKEARGNPEDEARVREKYKDFVAMDQNSMPTDVAAVLARGGIELFLEEEKKAEALKHQIHELDYPPEGIWPWPGPPLGSAGETKKRFIISQFVHQSGGKSMDEFRSIIKRDGSESFLKFLAIDAAQIIQDRVRVQSGYKQKRMPLPEGVKRALHDGDQALAVINELQKEVQENKIESVILVSEAKEKIASSLRGVDKETAKKALDKAIKDLGFEIDQKSGELKVAKKDFQKELGPFLEFCKAVRGYDLPLGSCDPDIWLMSMGRLFIGFEDVELTQMASLLETIEKCFKNDAGDIQKIAPNHQTAYSYLSLLFSNETEALQGYPVYFARKWARAGFPVIELGHKVASSLMFTQSTGDIQPPWPAFYIKVPDGLIVLGESVLRRVMVMRPITDEKLWWVLMDWRTPGAEKERVSVIKMNLDDDLQAIRKYLDVSDEKIFDLKELTRTLQLVANLIGGACMMIEAKEEIQERPWFPKLPKNRNRPPGVEPPEGTRFVIAKNVELDLREQVQQFVSGKAKKGYKLSVQYVVRGHLRHQACGKSHLERKLIWISPHWKGPLEGRALVRGYTIKQEEKEENASQTPSESSQDQEGTSARLPPQT